MRKPRDARSMIARAPLRAARLAVPGATALCLVAALGFAAFGLARTAASAQDAKPPEKKAKNRAMLWNPPNVDTKISVDASAPCDLAAVLKTAGERMRDQEENLPNFTADERIQYQLINAGSSDDAYAQGFAIENLQDAGVGTFEYLAVISNEGGGTSIQETRTPEKGSQAFPASSQDVGLPEMDFIFVPKLQADYDMKCAGAAKWAGQQAWLIHFQQRPDKIGHTLSFLGKDGVYNAKLKGRAWIAADTGDVMHLEISMIEPIPQMHVKNWWLSLDYAPVQFHSQNLKIWLPQTVDAYALFDTRRTIIYHTFSNFLLFSVQTQQKFEKPTQPEQKPQP
jgi:hypothetical protein